MPVFVFVALFLALATPAPAEPVARVTPEREDEVEHVRVPSSSDLVVGAVYDAHGALDETPRFVARMEPDQAGATLCVRATSIDGVYEAAYQYTVPPDWSRTGFIDFAYPTRFPDRVSAPPGETLAVAAHEGGCDGGGEDILVGYWNAPEESDTGHVLVALNTVAAHRATVHVGSGPGAPAVSCEPIRPDMTRAFDFLCRLPIGDVEGARVPIEIEVSRYGTRDPARTEWLRLNRP